MEIKDFKTAIGHVLQAEQRLLPEFRFEYTVTSGIKYPTAFEQEQRLVVNGTGKAQLFRRRSPAGTDVMPPGSYEGAIPKEEILDFLRMLETAPLNSIPAQVPYPGDPLFQLTLVAARKLFSFRWSLPTPPIPPDLEAVFNQLNKWVGGACINPLWSLTLKALSVRFTGEGIEATLRLENCGNERIYVVHPNSPGSEELKSLSIRHGVYPKTTPGVTPLPMEVQEEILAITPLSNPELISISAENPLEFTVRAPVTFTEGGGRVGHFSYSCYLYPSGTAGLPIFVGAVFSPETPL